MNYVVFDKGYEELRKLYVRQLSFYPVRYDKINYNGIKRLLSSPKLMGVDPIKNGFRLYYDKKALMLSLSGDMLRFRLKTLLHQSDYNAISQNTGVSTMWNIVTNYYSFFSSALFLLRLLHRGNIFFESDSKRQVEHSISSVLRQIISIDSNCTFKIDYARDCIELYKSDGNVHEAVWKEVGKVIEEMIRLSDPKSFERSLLIDISRINAKKGVTYPSQLRNAVNYQTEYVMACIENEYHRISDSMDYIRQIETYVYEKDEPLDKTINIYSAYHQYISNLSEKLFGDYLDMVQNTRVIAKYPLIGSMIR